MFVTNSCNKVTNRIPTETPLLRDPDFWVGIASAAVALAVVALAALGQIGG